MMVIRQVMTGAKTLVKKKNVTKRAEVAMNQVSFESTFHD